MKCLKTLIIYSLLYLCNTDYRSSVTHQITGSAIKSTLDITVDKGRACVDNADTLDPFTCGTFPSGVVNNTQHCGVSQPQKDDTISFSKNIQNTSDRPNKSFISILNSIYFTTGDLTKSFSKFQFDSQPTEK